MTRQVFEEGERLKKYRLRRGYTQKMLAGQCQCTQAYISMIESGKRKLTDSIIDRFCHALEVHPSILRGEIITKKRC